MPGNEFLGQEELDELTSIFKEHKGYLYRVGGTKVLEFEKEFAKKFNVRYAHAVSSGTAALKVALQALGVGPGDEVITQSHTFIATVEAIVECGATPVICPVNNTLNMNPHYLKSLITEKTKVVIPVHMLGVSCEMKEIQEVIYNTNPSIRILEDNAQSLGGTYNGQYLGTIGDMGIFSFDYGKMLTTGEGGMVVTNNEMLYKRARAFSDHGHEDKPGIPRGMDNCLGLGFNHKMSELNGAVGLAQLRKFDTIISMHRKNKRKLKSRLENIESNHVEPTYEFRRIPDPEGDTGDSVCFKTFNTKIFDIGLKFKNIPDAMMWHHSSYWYHIKFKNPCYEMEESLRHYVALPVMAKMTDEDIDKIVEKLKEIEK